MLKTIIKQQRIDLKTIDQMAARLIAVGGDRNGQSWAAFRD